jgi:class 3 adenylate cyclase
MYHNYPNLELVFTVNMGDRDWIGAPVYRVERIQQICRKSPLSLANAVRQSIEALQEKNPSYLSIDLVTITWLKPTGEWVRARNEAEGIEQLDFPF